MRLLPHSSPERSTNSSSSPSSMASPGRRSLNATPDSSDCDLCPSPPPMPAPSVSPFSTPAADDPVSTPIRFHHHSAILPAVPVAAASVVAGALLLLVAVLLFIRYRRRAGRTSAHAVVDADGDLFFEEGDGEFDHHIWYIRTVGLDESTIGAITAWAYKSDEKGVLGSSIVDCAVCLGEFRDGELLRLLPKCGHAFHQPCIDTWLRSHVNCPLCRAPVVVPTSTASTTISSSEGPGNIGASPSGSSLMLPPSAAFELENSRLGEGTSSPLESVPGGPAQETDCERLGFELQDRVLINRALSSELRVTGDAAGSGGGGLKAIHRSPSMDSLPLSSFVFRLKSGEGPSEVGIGPDLDEGRACKNRGEQEHASKRGSLLKETERSFSSVSRRFYLSRRGHCRNSILPL